MNSFIVDSRKVDKLVLELGATSKQATLALRSTVSKMATWLRARTLPELSRKLSMQQKIVRRRLKAIKFKQSQQGGSAKLFLGLNPVALIYLQPKTTPTGISAQGGRIVEGGFIPKWSKSKKQVL